MADSQAVIQAVKQWLEDFVVEYDICPFAKRELINNRVRFIVSSAQTEEDLLMDLQDEMELLSMDEAIETTLLIHPKVLQDFHLYNQFLCYAQGLIEEMELEGVYQLASFHPDYQFVGTEPEEVSNYTNRSPYPVLHILREASLERAIEKHPSPEAIPQRNIALMEQMGEQQLKALLASCMPPSNKT